MKLFLSLLAIFVFAVAAPLIWAPRQATPAVGMLPWQIELPAPGQSRVFGLVLGHGTLAAATLAEARRQFPEPPTLALVAPTTGGLSLEAYFDTVALGALTGKLLLTLDAAPAELDAMRQRAVKAAYMETGTKKIHLADADAAHAESLPLRAIAFIPSASLDAATVLDRFGTPAQRIRQGETLEHFLYPERGLDVVVDIKGREVLQYVAPNAFAALREPLLKLGDKP